MIVMITYLNSKLFIPLSWYVGVRIYKFFQTFIKQDVKGTAGMQPGIVSKVSSRLQKLSTCNEELNNKYNMRIPANIIRKSDTAVKLCFALCLAPLFSGMVIDRFCLAQSALRPL